MSDNLADKIGLNNPGTGKGFKVVMWLVALAFVVIVIAMIGPKLF
jgi:hypothetical protein